MSGGDAVPGLGAGWEECRLAKTEWKYFLLQEARIALIGRHVAAVKGSECS